MESHIKSRRLPGLPEEMRRSLIAARKSKGWSQAALGERVGLPQVHISRIESGKTSPQFNTLLDLVRVLDFDLILTPRTLVPAALALIQDHRNPDALDHDDDERPLYAVEPDDGGDDAS